MFWQLAAKTCPGNLMSIIKAYITLEHWLVILHQKIQNAQYSYQDKTITFASVSLIQCGKVMDIAVIM
jgi:hypothetical protein